MTIPLKLFRRRTQPSASVLLVDGDNTPPAAIPSILDELCRDRRPRVARIFLGRPHVSWQDVAEENGLEVVIVPAGAPGKNSVDIALAIEAMRHGFDRSVGEIVLVSSDSDFAYLAHQLRTLGKVVHGVGADHTPLAFRTACSRFTVLSTIWAASKARVPKGERYRQTRRLKRKIIQCLPRFAEEDGWASVQRLERFLRARDATFDPRSLGYRDFGQLLGTIKEIERDRARARARLQDTKKGGVV